MSRCHCTLLRTATRRVAALYDQALAPLGINIAQYSLLKTIERLQPVSMTTLGAEAQLERSTIGRNVRVLERMALVEVARGVSDQREAVAILSPRGVAILASALPLWETCQQDVETQLGPARITALREVLGAI